MKKWLVAALVSASCGQLAWADDAAPTTPKPKWKASAEVGLLLTSGNTESSSYSAKLKAKHRMEQWVNEYKLDGLFTKDQKTTDAGEKYTEKTIERYFASGQANYKLDDELKTLFVYASQLDDSSLERNYNEQTTLAVGYGTRLYDSENLIIDGNIGPGYTWLERESGEKDSGVIGRGKVELDWTISENANLVHSLTIESGADNTLTKSETAVMAKVNGSLQMKVGLVVTHNSDVDVDAKNTDTETTFTLVYNF